MKLTDAYREMLRTSFGEKRYQEIIAAYEDEPVRGLRINAYKRVTLPFTTRISALNPELLIPEHYAQAVTHPFHHAGSYYIQDPSASLPVVALDLQVDDCVLDMCAAPGGKSTYILDQIPQGFLISNEFEAKRALKLKRNLERWGCENYTVLQEDAKYLHQSFQDTFTKVLLDAPCSGEGLYRKQQDYALTYHPGTAQKFAYEQKQLLMSAYEVCCDGGIIVYSTCTLNTVENEGVILDFLAQYPECELEQVSLPEAQPGYYGLDTQVARYFPSAEGEGQFIAKIRVHKQKSQRLPLRFSAFKPETKVLTGITLTGHFHKNKVETWLLKERGPLDYNVNIIADGVDLGIITDKYVDWNHGLSQSLAYQEAFPNLELSLNDSYRYLYGQPLASTIKGYQTVSYQGMRLGFVKGNGQQANNKYPKGLRNKFEYYDFD